MSAAYLVRVNGALVEARPLREASLYELARVGERGLLGEVIRVEGETATIQVFEETSGLSLREPVTLGGTPLTAELGPGLLGGVFDGVGRPLEVLARTAGDFVDPGCDARTLDPERRWDFAPACEQGRAVGPGDVLGSVEDVGGFRHLILVPPGRRGTVASLRTGSVTVDDAVCELADGTGITLSHRWPVRSPRPFVRRRTGARPFVTGQRVFDFLFPVAEGGSVAVPGGFGTGKTVIEQSLAKFAEADVVVYVGCGERGNEMADVLEEFAHLTDPRSGRRVMDRTVLVVNTSNMPVAAREASVYFGVTVAEYFRDMGMRVAVMADSLSRWAEALREIGGRLQEMPGEEGYPTSLGNRLSKIYERAGAVEAQGEPPRCGAVTFISAVSPPGGDFSEPVTQASLRVSGALWALDATLAHQRQFPAVDWETSYSLYEEAVSDWFREHVAGDWSDLRRAILELLSRDRELREIAGLVGPESLEDIDRVVLDVARLIREAVIGQSAFDAADAFSSVEKTHVLAGLAVALYRGAADASSAGAPASDERFAEAVEAIRAVQRTPSDDVAAAAAAAREAIGAIAPREGRP